MDQPDNQNIKNQVKKVKIYNQITNEKRSKIIKLVLEENKLLKEAASLLKINYSTAKTIMRIYRKENRILRKSDKLQKIFVITKERNKYQQEIKVIPRRNIINNQNHHISTNTTPSGSINNFFQLNESVIINKKSDFTPYHREQIINSFTNSISNLALLKRSLCSEIQLHNECITKRIDFYNKLE